MCKETFVRSHVSESAGSCRHHCLSGIFFLHLERKEKGSLAFLEMSEWVELKEMVHFEH